MFQKPKGPKYTRNKKSLHSQKFGNGTHIYENQKMDDQIPKRIEKLHFYLLFH